MTELVPLLNAPTAIVGTTGAGKTFTARGAVEQLLELGRRVVIVDPTGVWWGLRSPPEGTPEGTGDGYPVVIFGGDHADIGITEHDGKAIALAMAERQVQAIIDVSDMTGGEKVRFLTDFFETLYAKNRSALHLVVDEADETAPQNPMPETRRLSGVFDKIVRRGRVKGFRPLMITQRPAVLHKNVLSQIGTLIALKLTSPQDRKAIEGWVSGNADAAEARSVMKSLPTLDQGEGWVWSPAAGVLERRHFPAITTFDSGRSPDDGEVAVEPLMSWVDVADLREAMAASRPTVAPGKDNVSAPAAMGRELELEHQRGYDLGYEAGLVEGIDRGRKQGIALGLTRARTALDALRVDEINEAGEKSPTQAAPETPAKPDLPAPRRTSPGQNGKKSSTSGVAARVDGLGPAKVRILTALRQLEALDNTEPDKASVAWFAGASPKSSAFANNLGAMRTAGLVDYPGPGRLCLTEAGRALVAPVRAPSHADIMALVADKLQPAQLRLLQVAINVWPGAVRGDELASLAGVSPVSSAFANNRGRLRSLGLLTYPEAGLVRAADVLFPDGAIQ